MAEHPAGGGGAIQHWYSIKGKTVDPVQYAGRRNLYLRKEIHARPGRTQNLQLSVLIDFLSAPTKTATQPPRPAEVQHLDRGRGAIGVETATLICGETGSRLAAGAAVPVCSVRRSCDGCLVAEEDPAMVAQEFMQQSSVQVAAVFRSRRPDSRFLESCRLPGCAPFLQVEVAYSQ